MRTHYSFDEMIKLARNILDDSKIENEFEKKYNKYTEVE